MKKKFNKKMFMKKQYIYENTKYFRLETQITDHTVFILNQNRTLDSFVRTLT